jgi:hypothetical protein
MEWVSAFELRWVSVQVTLNIKNDILYGHELLTMLRTGTNPLGGAAGCSVHTLSSRLTRHKFSSSEFISEKNPLASEVSVQRFSKSVGDFLLLMKTVGAVLPPPA